MDFYVNDCGGYADAFQAPYAVVMAEMARMSESAIKAKALRGIFEEGVSGVIRPTAKIYEFPQSANRPAARVI